MLIATYIRTRMTYHLTGILCYSRLYSNNFLYRIRQNIRGGKLSRFLRILAKRECFTIETFPASQLENNYRSQ